MARWGCYDSRGPEPRVRESAMKPVGKPDARNGHVRFDERGRETGRRSASVPAPVLDSTCGRFQSACPVMKPKQMRPIEIVRRLKPAPQAHAVSRSVRKYIRQNVKLFLRQP